MYLGVFVILSTAYDNRFYHSHKPAARILKEAAFAVSNFHSLLHTFSCRFIVVLEGEVVSITYVVDRMLGEFAAASLVLLQAVYESEGYGANDEIEDRIPRLALAGQIETILQTSHPEVFPYYSRCLDGGHKDFLWTGPDVQILRRSETLSSLIPLMTNGEILDLPSHQIYTEDVDADLSIPPDTVTPQVGKRRERSNSPNVEEGQERKRGRKS